MRIDVRQIPFEGLSLEEEINPSDLDLESEIIGFKGPVKVKAEVSRITNAVTVSVNLVGLMRTSCSRCLKELELDFKKNILVSYPVDGGLTRIDLDPDIREEIILDYPMKPLCGLGCKGLCAKCGKNLNEGGCSCAIT